MDTESSKNSGKSSVLFDVTTVPDKDEVGSSNLPEPITENHDKTGENRGESANQPEPANDAKGAFEYLTPHEKVVVEGVAPCHSRKEVFLTYMSFPDDSGCIRFLGAIGSKGYGSFSIGGKWISAHRASYQFFKGEIPRGLFVLHKCDNRSCVNPDHLYLGTHSQNMKDRDNRGRTARGEKVRGVLTAEKVRKIRELRRKGLFMREISELLGIPRTTVSGIIHGANWSHIQ